MRLTLCAVVCFIIFFAPLSFGAVQPWAQFLLFLFSCALCALLPFKSGSLAVTKPAKPVLFVLCSFFVIALAQSLNIKTIFTAPFWLPFTIGPLDTLDFAGYLLTCIGFFIAIPQLFQKHSSVKLLCGVIMFSGLITALIGLSSVRGEYINFFTGIGFLKETFGPFLNRNHAAVFLNLCFFSSLALSAPALAEYKKETDAVHKKELLLKALPFLIISTLLAGGIIYSRSRGGILALTGGTFVYAALLATFLKTKLKKLLALLLLGGLFASLFFAAGKNVDDINKFARRGGENWGYSVETRKNLYNAGYYMLMDYKTFGVGFNAFSAGIYPYLDKPIKAYVEHLHNDWLEFAVGGGLIAAVILFLGAIWLILTLFVRFKNLPADKLLTFTALLSGLFSMALASFFDFHFFIPSNAVLFFIILGLLCAPTFSKEKIATLKITPLFTAAVLIVFTPFILINFNKTEAWRLSMLAKGVEGESKILYFQKALAKYPHPRQALRLSIAQYNLSNNFALPCAQRQTLRSNARSLSAEYLQKYPLYRELENVRSKSEGQIFCKI